MADKSKIEWTDATWNPIVGCSIVSPGCTNCYAMKMAARIERMAEARRPGGMLGPMTHYAGTTQPSKAGAVWTGKVRLAPENILLAPLRWRKPKRIFVNSMGDLFHESIPDEWILRVLDIVRRCSYDGGSNIGRIGGGVGEHIFQVLTKRAKRMAEFMPRLRFNQKAALNECALYLADDGKRPIIMKNLWLGVSAERQEEADERIPHLMATPAAVRFVSAEPLLGPITLSYLEWAKLDWIIGGGESGSKARGTPRQYYRLLRDQCASVGVPYFHKQNGEWIDADELLEMVKAGTYEALPGETFAATKMPLDFTTAAFFADLIGKPYQYQSDGTTLIRLDKKAAGRLLDGKEHNGFPLTKAKNEAA